MNVMFGRKKTSAPRYDAEKQKPILHKSICTGETTAGFLDLPNGKYHEIMLIQTPRDLQKFMKDYGLEAVPETKY